MSLMAKPNILILENSIAVTGALKSILNSASALNEYFRFSFIIPRKSTTANYIRKYNFDSIEQLDFIELNKGLISIILYFPQLIINAIKFKKILNRQNIHLVHVNDLYNLIPAMSIVLGTKVPYICHIRFLPDRFPKILFTWWLRIHLRYAKQIIAVSGTLKSRLPSHQKINMIHDALPINIVSKPSIIKNTNKDHLVFLYLANFIHGKGQNYALEAFNAIHQSLPNWKLRFVGGNMGLAKNIRFFNNLRKQAENYGIEEKIEWTAFTDDVVSEYMLADIVLNFSDSESFSMTCLEALYYGVPLIATKSGGPQEILEEGETGLLVRTKAIDEMSEAMLKLASQKELRNAMSEKAKGNVRERFSYQKTSTLLMESYNKSIMQA